MKSLIPQRYLEYSKQLRTSQTPWEWKLWKRLRAGRFYSLKFKRQVLINGYIVDFCCHSKKLIIEIDGGYHNEEKNRVMDKQRQGILENQGYTVLRFWNNEIDRNLDGVLQNIKDAASV